jgi:antitoxin component YwqK of YwqJK toxin-antitoxin module
VEGSEEGLWKYYNGGAIESGSYYDGTRQGLWRIWYANGVLASELEYDQGLPNGKSIDYWETGTVKSSGHFVAGMRSGLWYKYDENAALILTTQYKNGRELKWNSYQIDE